MGHCLSSAAFFSCGFGLGGLALKRLTVRDSLPAREPTAALEPRATSSNVDAEEECKWLHSLLNILWPRIDKFLGVMVQEQIIPEIDRALPKVLKGSVKFPKVELGRAVPTFRNIRLHERSDQGIVLQVSIDLSSEMDVQIQALRVPIGMKRLQFSGELNVVFHPVSAAPPFFGGVTAFFIDPPRLDMDFTGAADFVDMPIIRDGVRSVILSAITSAVVLPARIAIDLKEDDDTDQADLTFPPPLGILRILVRSGKGLVASDFGGTSDPFVVIEVGQQRWESSVIQKTLDPVWEHGNVHDFLVYDRGQKANFLVFDKDKYSNDDLIGSVSRFNLEPLMSATPSDTSLPLTLEGEESAGTLQISSRWLELSATAPLDGIPSAVAKGPSQLVLAVKLLGIIDLPRSFKPPFAAQVEISAAKVSRTSRKSNPPANIKPVAAEVADIARRLHKARQSVDKISEITGLEPRAVNLAIAQDSPQDYALAKKAAIEELNATHPTFNEVMHIPLPWTSEVVESAMVSIIIFDKSDRRVAEPTAVRLAAVATEEVEGGFALSCGGTLQAKLGITWMELPK